MRISFLGATRTTTGSMYLIEVNGSRILLECGLFQGRRGESIEKNQNFPFDPSTVEAVILSHSHIDHSGNLPNLCRQGFQGNIYCTFATRDLASIMLTDSAHIQKFDADFVNKKHLKKGLPLVEPLYSVEEAEKSIRQFVGLNYERSFPIANGVRLTFYDAGHILGSAQVALDVEEPGHKFRYLFSGDIGRGGHLILRDPVPVEGVDYLQIESTYGNREHETMPNAREKVCELIKKAVDRGGKVVIPAFSVGRTQTLVYTLHQLYDEGLLPEVPIYVDSPLSVNATEVFRLHPECFNDPTYNYLMEKTNPFGMNNLTYIRDVEQSMRLNDIKGPAIIISASGMCEGGRIRHHLKNNLGNPDNLILFIGYCAQNTLGSILVSGKKKVNIFGEPHQVRAEVASIDSFSGHADRSELIDYVNRLKGPLKSIFVIHGEEDQSVAFGKTLQDMKPDSQVYVPHRGEYVDLVP